MCQIWTKVILLLYQCPTNFWVINVQKNDGNSDLYGWFNKEVHLPSISEIFFCDSFSIIFWSHWILATSATFSASEKINWCILFHRFNRFSQIYLYVENVHSKHPSFAVLIFKNVVLSSPILLDRLTQTVALNSSITLPDPYSDSGCKPNGYFVIYRKFHTAQSWIQIPITTAKYRNGIRISTEIGISICERK